MRGVHLTLMVALLSLAGPGIAAAQEGQGQAPSFCRDGSGHPVHGRSWCVQKGFRLGATTVWNEARWDDAVLRAIRRSGSIPRAVLHDVLGAEVLERIESQRRRLSASSALSGRWLSAEGGGTVLQVFAGRTPVAELADWSGNGRVDLVLLNAGPKQHEPRNADR
jgi:hypothetical protein